jgi:DNA-binding NtrC family response regulator
MPFRKRIFVVEDDQAMRTLLADFLSTQGHRVECFPSGLKLLKKLKLDPQNCVAIIADVVMPGMDGMELLKHVKQDHPEIPLILVTAFASEHGAMEAAQYGAAGYFTKPFKLDLLESALARALKIPGGSKAQGY